MYSFLISAAQRLKETDPQRELKERLNGPAVEDKNPMPHTQNVGAAIFDENRYEWFTFKGKKPVTVQFRNKPVEIKKGQKFGVRPSTNGKDIRLIFPEDKNRVITLTMDQAKELAKNV